MPTYIIQTRTSVVRSYRVSAADPKAAVDKVEYGDPDDETDEGENITDIFKDDGGVLTDIALSEIGR